MGGFDQFPLFVTHHEVSLFMNYRLGSDNGLLSNEIRHVSALKRRRLLDQCLFLFAKANVKFFGFVS